MSSYVSDPQLVSQFGKEFLLKHGVFPLYQALSGSCFLSRAEAFVEPVLCQAPEASFIPVSDWEFYVHAYRFLCRSGDTLTLLDEVLLKAFFYKASDLHLYALEQGMRVCYRVNGLLFEDRFLDSFQADPLVRLIKFHANMDVSTVFKAQDQRLSFVSFFKVEDIRVSSVPTLYGEDFVFRFFSSQNFLSFEEMGFLPSVSSDIQALLAHSSGLVLVTGPTGSGKSTTLYQCLRYLNSLRSVNIVSIEDPIECVIEGVRQIPVGRQEGETFSSVLRSVLRQDPDVIMVGEIRDEATARVALEAAYTGHLVLASLHTDRVSSTLLRLLSYSLDPFWMMSSLRGILSQRFVQSESSCRTLLSECFVFDSSASSTRLLDPMDFLSFGRLWSFEEDFNAKFGEF